MSKSKKRLLIVAAVLALAAAVLLIVRACVDNQSGFMGSRTKNPDAYLLDITRMNGEDEHTLTLHAGDALRVHIEATTGALQLTVTAPDGSVLYTGNGTQARDFTLNASADGDYTLSVTARQAKGVLRVEVVPAAGENP